MNATITSLGGRAPPGRNTRTLSAKSRWPASARGPRAPAPSTAAARRSSSRRAGRVSRSAWRTHRRSVSAVHPSFSRSTRSPPTATGARRPCSCTIRTARSRTSGEYSTRSSHGSILSTNGPSDNPGTIHSSIGERHPQRISALIYLDAGYRPAYNPAGIPGVPPIPSPSANAPPQPPAMTAADRSSFQALRAWCIRFPGFSPPEAELRQEFELTPDGHVGKARTPPSVETAILAGTQHYTDIRAPALAIYAVPHDQGPWVNDDPAVRAAADAAAERDIKSTGGQADAFERGVPGARVVRLAHANHYVFMSNEADVLREMRAFLSTLH